MYHTGLCFSIFAPPICGTERERQENLEKPIYFSISISILTRLTINIPFTSHSSIEIQISDWLYPQHSKAAFGLLTTQHRLPAQREKGDPLNCLASLCYKQEYEQLLQIIKFWGGRCLPRQTLFQ